MHKIAVKYEFKMNVRYRIILSIIDFTQIGYLCMLILHLRWAIYFIQRAQIISTHKMSTICQEFYHDGVSSQIYILMGKRMRDEEKTLE